jgi:alpha-1,2-mannosyltransferase
MGVAWNQDSPTRGGLLNDFFDYWGAARLLDLGGDPYDVHALGQVLARAGVHSTLGTGYSYPLLLAELLRPLGLLPPAAAGALFTAGSLVCLALAVALLLSGLRRASRVELAVLATAAGLFAPVRGSLFFGQVNLVVLPLLSLALLRVGRPAALAAASAVKLYPAAAILAFAVEGRRGVGSLLGTLAAALALVAGPNLLAGRWSYGGNVVAMFRPDPYWTNESVNGALSRLLPHGLPETALMVLVCAALGALAAAVAARQRHGWPGAYAILLCYGVVAAPKNSLWNFAPLLVVVVLTWSLVRGRPAAVAVLALAWTLIDVPTGGAPVWLASAPLSGALLLGGLLGWALLLPRRGDFVPRLSAPRGGRAGHDEEAARQGGRPPASCVESGVPVMLEPEPGFSVDTETLVDAGVNLKAQADDIQGRIAPWWTQVDTIQASLDAVGAGGAWTQFTADWDRSLRRLNTAVAGYAANTSLAAVVYEHADLTTTYSVPKIKVAPPPSGSPGSNVA